MEKKTAPPFTLYTVAQVQEAEKRAETEFGIPLADLMEKAGQGLACAALEMLPAPDASIGIFCGSGNNGGDGYVCATRLMSQGKNVTVWGIGHDKLTAGSLAGNAAGAYIAAGGSIRPFSLELTPEDIRCGLIVDSLLGTGLTRPVSGLYSHAIELINSMPSPVLSCDLPSGVGGDDGQIMGVAVNADRTLMMGLAKMACALPPGCDCFGEAMLCDIGLNEPAISKASLPILI